MPETPIIRRFLEFGGEIVTVGSDAHEESAAGWAVNETLQALKREGLKYVCTYEARRPKFLLIP
jgi:histidinol-phosphatase (PHP family)